MPGNYIITLLALLIYFTTFFTGVKDQNPLRTPGQSGYTAPKTEAPRYGTVSAVSAQLRTGLKNSTIMSSLPQGTGLQIMGSSGQWYNVKTSDGQTGWVAKWLVKTDAAGSNIRLGDKEVAVYYSPSSSWDNTGLNSLRINAKQITSLVPFSFQINQYGNIQDKHQAIPVQLAKSRGVRTIALIHNIQGSIFSGNTAHNLLTNAKNRRNAIDNILTILSRYGYAGVNIDFENVKSNDRWAFTLFIKEMSYRLHAKGYLATASIPAKTFDNPSENWSGAYDYRALGMYLDQIMIMTYDQHTADSNPGPVASYSWVRKVIRYAVTVIPRQKVLMGIAGYGYDWPRLGKGKAITFVQIDSLVKRLHILPQWDAQNMVPHFTYWKNGLSHKVYYENNQSLKAKLNVIHEFGIRGVALWRLGQEDPLIWTILGQYL
ncbi:MAG: glycosyl hydrolase family 18 protein [Bacillota bacterium]